MRNADSTSNFNLNLQMIFICMAGNTQNTLLVLIDSSTRLMNNANFTVTMFLGILTVPFAVLVGFFVIFPVLNA